MKKKLNKICYSIVLACCILSAFVIPSMASAVENSECFPVYALMPVSNISFLGGSGNTYLYEGFYNVTTGKEYTNTTDRLETSTFTKPNLNNTGANNISIYGRHEVKRASLSNQVYMVSGNIVLQSGSATSENYANNYNTAPADAYFKSLAFEYEPFIYNKLYYNTNTQNTRFVLYTRNIMTRFADIVNTIDGHDNNVYMRVRRSYDYQYIDGNGVLQKKYAVVPHYVSVGNILSNDIYTTIIQPLNYGATYFVNGVDYLINNLKVNIDFEFYTKVGGEYVRLYGSNYTDPISTLQPILYNIGYSAVATRTGTFMYNGNWSVYSRPATQVTDFVNDIKQNITVNEFKGDYVAWLSSAIGGFMDSEIFPNFTIGGMLGVIVAIPLAVWFLKLFSGG